MNIKALYSLKYMTLKKKLCIFTVILIGIVMAFSGYTVIRQQRETLLLQMEGTGRFLVKNLAKNVVGPLLEGDSLSLSNLIASLEARDKLQGNPARFTQQEYDEFLAQFFLEEKIRVLDSYITKKGNNVYIEAENILDILQQKNIGGQIFQDMLGIVAAFDTRLQYETFFEQYPWTRSLIEPLLAENETGFSIRAENISDDLQSELSEKITKRIFNEILNHVKNPFIGYAIIIDKDEIIQAHPDINEFVGKKYVWPEGTEPLKEGEELKVQRCFFKGEPHYDFAAPVIVRDKNIGTALIGRVHIGLRENYILQDIQKAKAKIIYVTIIAIILGSAGAYLLAALIVKPVKALVKDAEILGGGNLDHQIHVGTHDEVGALAATLDSTRIKLKDAQEKLIVSERLARELEIAREIQMTLLPKETPRLDRVEIGTLYRAASQVGGDLYDFFWVSEHELGIVIADVAGKGIPGSLMMTMAKAVIRAKAVKSESPDHLLPVGVGGDPASVIRKANQMIAKDIKKGMFITANYSILNVNTLRFNFVSAGHNDTLVYNSRTGELREYNPKGIALGLDKGKLFDMLLQDQELTLSPGDLLFQYTDGVNEAMNKRKEEFGEERLKDLIKKHAHQNVNDFLSSLDQAIRAFTEGFPQSDDITAVVVKVKE
jgi:serine phosphatase RsbU (regulator of sigma subunit)